MPEAVLWDMDGTLVNSEPYWMAAETELFSEHGLRWTYEDGLHLVGRSLLEAAGIMASRGVPLAPEAIVAHLLGKVVTAMRADVPWQPGALELLTGLRDAGIPCALVTMSYRILAETVTQVAPENSFELVVSGDEVTHGKPHPEPYLRAAELLGVDISRCVAIEDSRPGIASALASGARTIGVEAIVPVEPAPQLSRVASLAQLDVQAIRAIAGGEVLDLLPA
jgi:HAD superfamily hydrolase (TIGR01509 family)